jgi:dTDP-glucose 4,6-dehydratase
MRLLVTGGAGFIGSNFIRHMLTSRTDVEVVNLDALTYAGNLENLEDIKDDPRYRFVQGDICDATCVQELVDKVDGIVNFAAETHVDRSITSDYAFIRTNVAGVQTLLAAAVAAGGRRFLQVSTDEVYGDLPWRDFDQETGSPVTMFTEQSLLNPSSPYAASKAAADHLCHSYFRTHGLDVIVTRSPNNYGSHQFPEKLIPLAITNALEHKRLPVYGDGLNIRDWLHVQDHCRGIELAFLVGRAGETYNFGARAERTNLQVVRALVALLGAPEGLIEFVSDRPGHDRRYAVDPTKAEHEFQWRAETPFNAGLEKTVAWYLANKDWWQRVKNGTYRSYYEDLYGSRGRHATSGKR